MKILLKDGSIREYDQPKKVNEIARNISQGLERAACASKVNGRIVDLRYEIKEDCELAILTFNEEEGKGFYTLLFSQILLQAV